MEADAALRRLQRVATDRLIGDIVGSDRLIQLGLDALVAGVDAPSLASLAGLSRAEEPDAGELFDRVAEELGLVPADLPSAPVDRAWALVRWWAQLMVDGTLDIQAAGSLIYGYAWPIISAADPQGLQPLITRLLQYEDATSWSPGYHDQVDRSRKVEAELLAEARTLLSQQRFAP
jgi:hypothetical protein